MLLQVGHIDSSSSSDCYLDTTDITILLPVPQFHNTSKNIIQPNQLINLSRATL